MNPKHKILALEQFEAYPAVETIHISSDDQVFHQSNYNDAVNHQYRLDKAVKLVTISRKDLGKDDDDEDNEDLQEELERLERQREQQLKADEEERLKAEEAELLALQAEEEARLKADEDARLKAEEEAKGNVAEELSADLPTENTEGESSLKVDKTEETEVAPAAVKTETGSKKKNK